MEKAVFVIARISKDPYIRQAEMIEQAQALFFRKGYQATTVQDIVQAVGVAHGTFYYHFASKEVLLEAIVVQKIDQQIAQAQESEEVSLLLRLKNFIRLFYQICYKSEIARLADILYAENQGELINRIWRQSNARMEPVLLPLLEACNDAGITSIENMSETLWFLRGILATLLETSTPDGYAHETNEDRLKIKRKIAARLIDHLLGLPDGTMDLSPEKSC